MNILIIDNGSRNLSPLLTRLAKHTLTTVPLGYFDFGVPALSTTDLILVPGASQYDIEGHQVLFEKESAFIRQTPLPLLGICFGAELMACAYGNSLTTLPEKIEGVCDIEVRLPSHPLFAGRTRLQVRESHRFAILDVHHPLTTLASSDSGIEIFEHIAKPQLGMQFHPESLTHTADGEWLLERAIKYVVSK